MLRSQPRCPSALRKIVLNLDSLLKSESAKTHFEGTHRTISPETTWARMSPFLPSLGITRLANVTGLDRVGIPVYMSCRPNSRSLAVSQGKGLSNISAKVSALMESTEQWHGEFNSCLTRVESYAHLKSGALVCDPDLLPLVERSAFTSSRPIPWAMGTDLLSGRPIWVPYEMVHVNTTVPFVPGSGCFVSGSNGLASGNNLLEAILHGLYELVERDALALWEIATPDRWSYRRVDSASDRRSRMPLASGAIRERQHRGDDMGNRQRCGVARFYVHYFRPGERLVVKAAAGCFRVRVSF